MTSGHIGRLSMQNNSASRPIGEATRGYMMKGDLRRSKIKVGLQGMDRWPVLQLIEWCAQKSLD